MKIVVTGGTGFIGQPLVKRLLDENHAVVVLSRNPSAARFERHHNLTLEQWNASTVGPWKRHIETADGVINLAGASIGKRWTSKHKERILNSRLQATGAIVQAIAQASKKPSVLVSVSAVGYYGHVESGDVLETHPPGNDFLARVCIQWEDASRKAAEYGVRVVNPRFGIILAKNGGALKKFLPPFYLFIGGPLGSGNQWFPWIHRDDVIAILLFLLQNDRLSGPVNVGSPNPVTMKEFCTALGNAMYRPSWARVPSFMLKVLLGEMSQIVLTGQRIVPKKLLEAGYTFRYPELSGALEAILAK